jgi:diguanylate cyclase (GGDEF)-like protein
LTRRQRYGHPFSLLMLDLDHFKRINDQWGHAVGDEALRQFADSVRCCLRAQDVAGRLGGEEFAILLPETGENVAMPVAERIRARMEQTPVPTEPGYCTVTVSIGVTQVEDGDDLEALLRRADEALYAAKERGRNRVVSSLDLKRST